MMRRNILILVLAMILILVLFFVFVFKPQSSNIDKARADALAAENQVQKLQLELQRLEGLKAAAPKLREQTAKLDAAIPTDDPHLAQFILQIQDAANASGVDWASISPTPPALVAAPAGTAGGYSEVSIAMNVSGGYFQVQDFLVRLENLPRAVKILALNLTPKELPDLGASLTMKMFVAPIPPKTPVTPPATTTPGA